MKSMEKTNGENVCDEQLFSAIYNKLSDSLYHFLYYKFGEEYLPSDKVQEAFVKLWQNCAKVAPNKAKSYLFTIGNNLMLNEVAHKKVVLRYRQRPQKTADRESPEFLLRQKEYQEKLNKAINQLTEAQRVAFLLNRVEGKRFKEIAEILEISVKAVEKRVYSALKELRKEIHEL
jgi:RNA polymerase sigma-70 factor (ECF subfamily)